MEVSHPKVGGMFDLYNMREYWDLPEDIREKVCHGYRRLESKSHTGVTTVRGVPACGTCNKPFVHLVFPCLSCNRIFIKDFRDPRFCPMYPHCWDCLDKVEFPCCKEHALPIYRNDLSFFPYLKPAGLNPKRFSPEELANAFDF